MAKKKSTPKSRAKKAAAGVPKSPAKPKPEKLTAVKLLLVVASDGDWSLHEE